MNSTQLDITKPVMTRDGKVVKQLTKFEGVQTEFPLLGVLDGAVISWAVDGRIGSIAGSINDIINVPEKKVVPLSFGDIMPGDLIRTNTRSISLVTYVVDNFIGTSNEVEYSFDALRNSNHNWQYSQDRGKTWRPFYKQIEV